MPHRQITRVDAAPVQGQGAFVLLHPLTVGEARACRQWASLPAAERAAAQARLLADHIAGWNWADAGGRPLPLPSADPAVLDRLSAAEIAFLARALAPDEAAIARQAEALLAALWTANPARLPDAYAEYRACKLYGCTPSALDAEAADRVALHLAFAEAERRARRPSARGKRRSRGAGGSAAVEAASTPVAAPDDNPGEGFSAALRRQLRQRG